MAGGLSVPSVTLLSKDFLRVTGASVVK